MSSKIFADTNILLYSLDSADINKRDISLNLLNGAPCIRNQNISEFINVVTKRWKYTKQEVELVLNAVLYSCILVATNREILLNALLLVKKYDFQIFDSIIVASALKAGCTVLFTEDVHHGLVIEKQLQIINPFF